MPRKKVGSHWESELKIYKDAVSGATIHQLTDYKAHSNHFYFTYPCWFDQNRKIVIYSDRDNSTNLYSVDLESGEIVQLTDHDPQLGKMGGLTLNSIRNEVYFAIGSKTFALDLATLNQRVIYTKPDGFVGGSGCATADGQYLIVGIQQDLSDRIMLDLGHGYIGFNELFEARPHCEIHKINLETLADTKVFEDDCWLTHYNPSPKLAHIMTYCHEGPWHRVDNRIWGLDINTGKTWKIRPTGQGEMVGHEYWMPDGVHVGYHGKIAGQSIYGSIAYDNTDLVEGVLSQNSWHNHSYFLDLVVGDGNAEAPYLFLWRYKGGEFEGPRVLAWHRGSFHTQQVHVHPCFSPDGRQIIFTADPQGYGQVFMVDIPDFESLPEKPSRNKEV